MKDWATQTNLNFGRVSRYYKNSSVKSWQWVLLVDETEVLGENHWPVTSYWQTILHKIALSTPRLSGGELKTLVVIGSDCIGSYKSNYHTIATTTTPHYALIPILKE